MRIVDDRGGQVGKYLQAFAEVRSTGERVIIDGDCLSACTLVLGLVPSNQICATPRARFGFHAPLILNNEGLLVTRAKATQAMWNAYPASVQHWITQHGGLSRQMIYMEGHSLNGIVATCDPSTLRGLLVAGASGYSGTLVPRTSPHQPADRPFSARQVITAHDDVMRSLKNSGMVMTRVLLVGSDPGAVDFSNPAFR